MIEEMEITFRTSTRARHLRITIKSSGECVVTIPKRMPMVLVNRFVAEKAEWIRAKQAEWIRAKQEEVGKRGVGGWGSGVVGAENLPPMRKYADVKQESLRFATQRVEAMNASFGFSYKAIRVRNQKTRWGSCSRRGNLNFNYRILYLPPHLADYIVVHELCHLKEFHHGKKFWDLVARVFPNHQELRKELRGYQVGE